MYVEPSDSSYMPSLVVVSAGDTLNTMKEVKATAITSAQNTANLLQDCNDVSRFSQGKMVYLLIVWQNISVSLFKCNWEGDISFPLKDRYDFVNEIPTFASYLPIMIFSN